MSVQKQANARAGLARISPEVTLNGSYNFTNRDITASEAAGNSFKNQNHYWTIGLRVSAPLDLPNIFDTRRGYAQEQKAADLAFQRQFLDQEVEWKDLNRKQEELSKRLSMILELEGLQKEKFEHERLRQAKGRSTTYQVIQFEQDYSSVQIQRLQTQAELFKVASQLKLFQ